MSIPAGNEAQRRDFYLQLAARGLSMPIGADLVLHSRENSAQCLVDGEALGGVVVETARRFRTPLALPLMDLTLEKAWLLDFFGVPEAERGTFHFASPPANMSVDQLRAGLRASPPPARIAATCGALRHVARCGDLVPVGMAIGPFSLMTKLMADPITAVYLAGSGVDPADDDEVRTAQTLLELGQEVILRSIELQVGAGARMVCLCEPAANLVYLSPQQIEAGSDVFERFVMTPNRRIRQRLRELECDLMFHDCGELSEAMLKEFNTLDPAVLSLGSSRKLWLDARHVSRRTVLFGNLPSKKFFSESECSEALVEQWARELLEAMQQTGHPFILGTECDVLSVPAAHGAIMAKVERMCQCAGSAAAAGCGMRAAV